MLFYHVSQLGFFFCSKQGYVSVMITDKFMCPVIKIYETELS